MKKDFMCLLFFLLSWLAGAALAAPIIPAPPGVKATSYLLIDFDSGALVVEKNIDQRLAPASLAKIMTVYVVASELADGKIALQDQVRVSEKAWRTEGSRMFIEVGKSVKLADLLLGVIVQSGNDASVALAEYIAGSEAAFADLMNAHARRLGMSNTHYVNSTGLPHPELYTTARDLATLARAYIRDFPAMYELNSVREFTFNNIRQPNRNQLLWRDQTVDGIKTGHTQAAGYCLVASARREGMRLISVVMGADGVNARASASQTLLNYGSRASASQTLLNYGYRFYETRKLYGAGEPVTRARIWQADADSVALGPDQDVYLTLPRGQHETLKPVFEIDQPIIAPLNKGEQKGKLNILLADEKVATLPLLSMATIPPGSLFNRLKDRLLLWFK